MRVLHLVSWFLTASSDQSHSPSSSAWSKHRLWPLTASLSLCILYPFPHSCSSICEIFRWSPDSGLGLCWARGTERERGTSLLLNSIQSRKLKYQVSFKTEHREISSTMEMCARRHLIYLFDPGVELALLWKKDSRILVQLPDFWKFILEVLLCSFLTVVIRITLTALNLPLDPFAGVVFPSKCTTPAPGFFFKASCLLPLFRAKHPKLKPIS